MSSPEIYNQKRRIIFSTFHSKGPDEARKYLEGYRKILGSGGYAGLRAELEFYCKYKNELKLTVAGDMGEHADFAGQMGNSPVRFDVTTSIEYKKLKTYEKFICDGFDYKIAIYDQSNWEIIDVLELAFPKCSDCGDSFLFPLALMHSMNYNRHGDPLWHNDQSIIEFCPSCGKQNEKQNICNTSVRTYSELYDEYDDPFEEETDIAQQRIANQLQHSVKFLTKISGVNLVGLAEEGSRQVSKYDDEERGLCFPYLSNVVARQFPNFFEHGYY
jgi:hypothetical protein